MTLLSRLLLVVAVALLPALGFQAFAEAEARRTREALVHEEALRLAGLVAAEHRDMLEGARQLLTALGASPVLRVPGSRDCAVYSEDLLREFPRYATVVAAGPDGRILCAAHADGIGQDISDRRWFQDALRGGGFTVGDYIVGRGSGRPSFHLSQPWRNADGKVAGVVAAAIDLGWLAERLERLPLPSGAAVVMLDRNGTVLARHPHMEGLVGTPAPDGLAALLHRDRAGTEFAPGPDGVRRLFGFMPLGEGPKGVFIAVGLDAEAAFANAAGAARLGVALIVAGLLLALLLTTLGVRRLVRAPVDALLEAAERWGRGDLSARVAGAARPGGRDELARLAAAFDAMAASLQRREAALARSESRFRALLQNAPEKMWVTEADGAGPQFNASWCDYTGLPERPAAWDGVIHPADRERVLAVRRRAIAAGDPYTVDLRLRRASDGSWRWHTARVAPMRDEGTGEIWAWVGTAADIHGIRTAQARLAESEALFRGSFDQAAVGVAHIGLDSTWLRMNRRLCDMLGYDEAELATRTFKDITHPDDLDTDMANVRAVLAGETDRYGLEKRYIRRDGSTLWGRLTVSLRRDDRTGEPLHFISIVEDVSERVAAEAALARHAERQALLLEVFEAALAEGGDEATLGRLVFERVAPHLDADVGFNYALAEDGCTLRLVAGHGIPDAFAGGAATLALGQAYCGMVAATGRPLAADAARIAADAQGAFIRAMGVHAYACHPITGGDGRLLGTLSFASTLRDRFGPEETEFLHALSGAVALAWGRRRAEALARARLAELEQIYRHAPVGLFNLDRDLRFTRINERMAEINGLPVDSHAGRTLCQVVPDLADRLAGIYRPILDRGESVLEVPLTGQTPAAPGIQRDWVASYFPMRGQGGQVTGVIGAVLEVTESKRAERALAESEERHRLALSAADLGTWRHDVATGLIQLDDRARAHYGATAAVLPAADLLARVHPDDRAALAGALAASLDPAVRGPMAIEYRVEDGRGGWRWLSVFGQVAFRGEGAAARAAHGLGTTQDVTARKEAEAALRASEGRFARAVAAAGIGTWDWDAATDSQVNSPGYEGLYGRAPGEMGSRDAFLAAIHPADREAVLQTLARAVAGAEGDSFEFEFRVPLPGGGERWLHSQGAITGRGPDGAPLGMSGVVSDVTGRRWMEEELRRHREGLESLVEDRTRELHATQARLAEAARMEALGRLAGGIAHDFNNVLQAIQGGLTLATKRLRRDPDGAARFLGMASESIERGAAVTGRLLTFARRGELSAAPVAPGPLLDGLAQMLSHAFGPAVALKVEVAPDAPPLLADLGQLEAVLVNLANNARDALPEGRGTVTLSAAPDREAAHLPPGEYVRIRVTDDGHGMSPLVLARVTEPFFTTKPKGKGTGLGLAMARGFAEQSGGALLIESEAGRGTSVSLLLPRAAAAEAPAAGEPAGTAPAPARPGAAVLVVDDEPLVRGTLAAALAEGGHRVQEAGDGAQALARLEAGVPADVLVTDLAMPGGMDGLALIREARRRRPGLPAVLVTGHVGDAVHGALQEAAGAGPFAVLRKPVTAEAVEAQFAALLRHRPGVPRGAEARRQPAIAGP